MVARGQTLSGSHGLSGPARRHARRRSRKSGSHATRRWRDRDSNYWSPGRERVNPFGDVKQGMVTYTTEGGAETVSTSSGTEGSNPAPSSAESGELQTPTTATGRAAVMMDGNGGHCLVGALLHLAAL
jgi:hypothetical protein